VGWQEARNQIDWLFIENNTASLGDDLLMLGGTLSDRSKVIGTVTYYV
jgi:hypothetical protein